MRSIVRDLAGAPCLAWWCFFQGLCTALGDSRLRGNDVLYLGMMSAMGMSLFHGGDNPPQECRCCFLTVIPEMRSIVRDLVGTPSIQQRSTRLNCPMHSSGCPHYIPNREMRSFGGQAVSFGLWVFFPGAREPEPGKHPVPWVACDEKMIACGYGGLAARI